MRFEYYVLNDNFNRRKIEHFNIFDNYYVQMRTEKAVRKYLRSPKNFKYHSWRMESDICGFEGLCEEIRTIIMCEEWSRCEYEIAVGSIFTPDVYDIKYEIEHGEYKTLEELKEYIDNQCKYRQRFEKWDCYKQCEKNIKAIVYEVIRQYKEQVKLDKIKGEE